MQTICSNACFKKVLAIRNDSRTTPYISCTFFMYLDDFMNTPTFYLISILLFFNCIFCNFRFIVTTFFPLFFYSSQGFAEGLQKFRIKGTHNLSQKVKTNLNEIKFFSHRDLLKFGKNYY